MAKAIIARRTAAVHRRGPIHAIAARRRDKIGAIGIGTTRSRELLANPARLTGRTRSPTFSSRDAATPHRLSGP